jgi:uncharacterized repeat protein (TIGR03837 family)
MRFASIDLFCHVVDNFGDIGVVYRFAKEFAAVHPSCRVRVFCDDLRPLFLMVPELPPLDPTGELNRITFVKTQALDERLALAMGSPDIVIEAFGCDIPDIYKRVSLPGAAAWINLEHLSAEPWVEGYHLRPSLQAGGLPKKYFFMPGFSENTGGVIVDSAIEREKPDLRDNRLVHLNGFLGKFHVPVYDVHNSLFGTVFTYQRGYDRLLDDLGATGKDVYLFVMGEKSGRGMLDTLKRTGGRKLTDSHFTRGSVHALMMPFIPQRDFDRLLCLADFNMVRGEDSLVRAILAEKPFIWNAYLQDKKYHRVKVAALLDLLRGYFEDGNIFGQYRELMVEFNDRADEDSEQRTREAYTGFFRNLNKIERAVREISYFMTRKCNLVMKLSDFLARI